MLNLTEQQQKIIHSKAKNLAIKAFAGAAKTTTLIEYAKARPQEKMIYIAFNKSVADEAKRRFPANVQPMTTHSHAYQAVGHLYKKKLVAGIRERDLVQAVGDMDYHMATSIIKSLTHFMASGYKTLEGFVEVVPGQYRQQILDVWKRMCDPDDPSVGMTHDGYLKLALMQGHTFQENATLLLDEAQDSNAVTCQMFMSHPGKKVAVGDPHQQIYGFRGAVNALEKIGGNAERLILSRSFRTAADHVEKVNAVLHYLGETALFHGGDHHGSDFIAKKDPRTILARTNAGIFDVARYAVRNRYRLYFVGGIQNYRFDKILDAYHLSIDEKDGIKDKYIRGFKSWSEYELCAKASEDPESEYLVKVVDELGDAIPSLIDQIRAITHESPSEADVTLTTAHKSKGLEWDQVLLWDDFIDPEKIEEKLSRKEMNISDAINEMNLLYVSITRARKNLAIHNPKIEDWLRDQIEAPMVARYIKMD